MNKSILLFIGTIMGILGFHYADREQDGTYSLGLPILTESISVVFFTYFAYISKELASTILLQGVSGWHIAAVLKTLY